MKLFGHPDSGHAFKVRFLLQAAAIEHDYECVDIFAPLATRSAEFRQHARYGEVPTLVDDGRAYVQSGAILVHIAQHTGRWGAEDPATMTRCLEWLMWEANKIGMCLPQLRGAQRFDDMRLEEGALRWLLARYEHDVGILERELADGRSFMLGDKRTIADFALCGYLVFADEAKVSVPSQVTAWLARLSALPGWQHPYEMLA